MDFSGILLKLLTKEALALTIVLALVIEELKKLLPDDIRKYLPLASYGVGTLAGLVLLGSWMQGLLIGLGASAGFAIVKDLLQNVGKKK